MIIANLLRCDVVRRTNFNLKLNTYLPIYDSRLSLLLLKLQERRLTANSCAAGPSPALPCALAQLQLSFSSNCGLPSFGYKPCGWRVSRLRTYRSDTVWLARKAQPAGAHLVGACAGLADLLTVVETRSDLFMAPIDFEMGSAVEIEYAGCSGRGSNRIHCQRCQVGSLLQRQKSVAWASRNQRPPQTVDPSHSPCKSGTAAGSPGIGLHCSSPTLPYRHGDSGQMACQPGYSTREGYLCIGLGSRIQEW